MKIDYLLYELEFYRPPNPQMGAQERNLEKYLCLIEFHKLRLKAPIWGFGGLNLND